MSLWGNKDAKTATGTLAINASGVLLLGHQLLSPQKLK
jgi:hypothetical protein